MMRLFHWAAAALLLLCGWLTGSAFQARTEQHILQLQRTVELLQRIRQEIAYRRLDLEQLQRCLVQEKLLESDAAPKLQEIPAPERFDDAERLALSSALPALAKAKRHRNANDWIITLPVLKHSCTRRSRKRHPGKAYRAGLALQPARWQH